MPVSFVSYNLTIIGLSMTAHSKCWHR